MSSTASSEASTKPSTATGNQEPGAVIYGKSGKKICCSCPQTRKPRDECVVTKGESECKELIEAHNKCLREEGFNV